jgi:hypothetical protein
MRIKHLKYMLWTTAAALTAASAALIVWATHPPVYMNFDEPSLRRNPAESSPAMSNSAINVRELEQLALIDLRRPLHDPPIALAPTARAIPPLDIRLTGTIFEPGYSRAMIQLADGSVQLKAIGDIAGEARITDIQQGSIRVEYYGQSQQLAVVKEAGN